MLWEAGGSGSAELLDYEQRLEPGGCAFEVTAVPPLGVDARGIRAVELRCQGCATARGAAAYTGLLAGGTVAFGAPDGGNLVFAIRHAAAWPSAAWPSAAKALPHRSSSSSAARSLLQDGGKVGPAPAATPALEAAQAVRLPGPGPACRHEA